MMDENEFLGDEMTEPNLTKKQLEQARNFVKLDAALYAEGYQPTEKTSSIEKFKKTNFISGTIVFGILILLFIILRPSNITTRLIDIPILFASILCLLLLWFFIYYLTLKTVSHFIWGDFKLCFIPRHGILYLICSKPLNRNSVLISIGISTFVVIIVPYLISLSVGSFLLALISSALAFSLSGSILLALPLLKLKRDAVILEHPTKPGYVFYHK